MKVLMGLLTVLALNTATASAQGQRQAPARSPDEEFWLQAAADSVREVKFGQLAVERGRSPAVRRFGQRMVEEHAQAGKELLEVRGEHQLELPDLSQMPQQKQLWEKLARLEGEDFDRQYMQQMVEAHREAVKLFEKEIKDGKDEAVKSFAAKHLPTIKDHLKLAQEVSDNLKGGPGEK